MYYQEIKDELLHQTDGTVTSFVVMFRAIELASSNKYNNSDIANVLYEVLENFIELPNFNHFS